ncbi:hypothetical protein K2X30_11775 [bacterium]|nr:hypothetical protein [bacterium]
MTPQIQEWIAFSIVGVVVFSIALGFFRGTIAPAFAKALLKSGKVRWAMRFKKLSREETGCDNCSKNTSI